MFNDGIMPDYEFEKLCQQFYPHYMGYHGMDKDLWKKFKELFGDDDDVEVIVKKPSTQKSTKPKSTKPKNTHDDVDDDKYEVPMELLNNLLQVLTGVDTSKGKHEKKPTPPQTSPEVKKYMDDKTKISLTDEPKTKSTSEEKAKPIVLERKDKAITITLSSSKKVIWTNDKYDNYKLVDGCFVLVKNGIYVGIYNMKYVVSVTVE